MAKMASGYMYVVKVVSMWQDKHLVQVKFDWYETVLFCAISITFLQMYTNKISS